MFIAGLNNLISLFYPKKCQGCAKVISNFEEILCLSCNMELPLTEFTEKHNNMCEKSFFGRIQIEEATSLLYFNKKGISQRLIHQLKYKNQQQIGDFLGQCLGDKMLETDRFNTLNCIVPVPLHSEKFKKRGYNQVITFAEGLSKKLKIPVIRSKLLRVSGSKTQTFKNRFERWKNVEEIFKLSDLKIFKKKHVLLVDDVITTGATLESCAMELMKTDDIKISIATIVFTE